jgi:hypothetical protein
MGFGNIRFAPDLFDDDWPPPRECDIVAYYTATTEAAKETLFSVTASLRKINRKFVEYAIHAPAYTTEVASGTVFNDTLDNIVSWACIESRLNLTVDSSAARSTSPDIVYTTTRDYLLIDLLSEFCAFHTHLFYISGSTLYLVDMLEDNGSRTLTEFDYFPSTYEYKAPTRECTDNTYSSFSVYTYGRQIVCGAYHNTQANVEGAYDLIMTIANKVGAEIAIPFAGSIPAPGEKISWTDRSLAVNSDTWIRARNIRYDFDNYRIIVTGEGQITEGAATDDEGVSPVTVSYLLKEDRERLLKEDRDKIKLEG